MLGLAAAVKFAPLALAPLLLRGSWPTMRDSAMFVAALVVVTAVSVARHLPHGGLRELAVSLIARPGRRDLRQLAALAGAVTIAAQLTAEYWLYLYIAWFAPLVLIAAMGKQRRGRRSGSVWTRDNAERWPTPCSSACITPAAHK